MLINKKAPNFTSEAIINGKDIIKNFNFIKQTKNKYTVLFFWPLDFTFVCPSEIISFQNRYNEFKKRETIIIGCSIDSIYSHLHWINTPIEKGGIGKINFPLVSDIKREIQKYYNVEHKKLGVSLRATFLIDKKSIIRHQSINDLPIGRNIDEIIRIIDALIFYEKNGLVCPAQWKPGKDAINPTKDGIIKYLKKNIKNI